MSGPVCYLERRDGGDAIARARLFTVSGESSWTPPETPEGKGDGSVDVDPLEVPAALADWLAEKVGPGQGLGAIVLDTSGSLCAWTESVNAAPRLLPAAVSGLGADDDHAGPGTLSALLGPDHESPGAASLAALDPEAAERDAGRTAVVSIEDAVIRVLIDALDERGVTVGATVTLWEAMARVWDPGSPGSGGSEGGLIVADSAVPAAIVLQSEAGRIAWCWSLRGRVRCAGAMLASPRDEDMGGFNDSDAGRLASDWLGWAAQLGSGPERVVWIGADVPAGSSLSRLWPNSTTDAGSFDDPVGETLSRFVPAAESGPLESLANRPGRAHRSAFRWISAAMFVLALLAVMWGIRAGGAAKAATDRSREINAAWIARVEEIEPNAVVPGERIIALQSIRDSLLTSRAAPAEAPEPLDVMYEVENISLVLGGSPEVELEQMRVDQFQARLIVIVPSLEEYEAIDEGLTSIGGSIGWQGRAEVLGDQLRGTFTGTWLDDQPGGGT